MTILAVDSRDFCTTKEQSSKPNMSWFSLNKYGKIFSLFLSCGLV